MVRKRFWIVLPATDVIGNPELRVSPVGVVPQKERRPRIICDYTFSNVNQESIPLGPEDAMQFGRALLRLLTQIVQADPRFGAVLMAKFDLSDGYYRVPLKTEDALKLAVVLPQAENEPVLIAIPLVLPMGWTESPPFFCTTTETIADLANATLAQHPVVATHCLECHTLPSAEVIALNNRPLAPTVAVRPYSKERLSYVDVYLDDLIGLLQYDPLQNEGTPPLHFTRTVLSSIDQVFRPLDPTDSPFRTEPISVKKLVNGDGTLCTQKTILGWSIDTCLYTLGLTERKHKRFHELLDQFPRSRKRVSVKTWQKVLGELRSMAPAIAGSKGLFGPLQEALKTSSKRIHLPKSAHDFLDDMRWLIDQTHHRPVRLFELIPAEPTVIGTTDSSGVGCGGVFFIPTRHASPNQPDYESFVWRMEFPPELTANLITKERPDGKYHINELELLATIAQHDVVCQTTNVTEATIASLHDNTSAMYWNRKGSASTVGPTAYLLRLAALHKRHYRYATTHSYIPGNLNTMADDASRLFELTDVQLLTYFDLSFPQRKPWQRCTLRSQMHSSLISAMHRQRSEPALWQAAPVKQTNGGPNGWPSVPTSMWIPTSQTEKTPSRTSKFSRIGTELQLQDPPVNPFDLKQLLKPLDLWDKRTKVWGPKTSDGTPKEERISD
jgi:hypothetical protein